MNMFNQNPFGNPYGSTNDPNYVAVLEQRIKTLEEQQRNMVDPILVEFQSTPIYQNSKRDNFLTFLLQQNLYQWQQSDLGKEFKEWEKKSYEAFKTQKSTSKPVEQPSAGPNV